MICVKFNTVYFLTYLFFFTFVSALNCLTNLKSSFKEMAFLYMALSSVRAAVDLSASASATSPIAINQDRTAANRNQTETNRDRTAQNRD